MQKERLMQEQSSVSKSNLELKRHVQEREARILQAEASLKTQEAKLAARAIAIEEEACEVRERKAAIDREAAHLTQLGQEVQENSLAAAEKHKKAKEDREKAELALAETKDIKAKIDRQTRQIEENQRTLEVQRNRMNEDQLQFQKQRMRMQEERREARELYKKAQHISMVATMKYNATQTGTQPAAPPSIPAQYGSTLPIAPAIQPAQNYVAPRTQVQVTRPVTRPAPFQPHMHTSRARLTTRRRSSIPSEVDYEEKFRAYARDRENMQRSINKQNAYLSKIGASSGSLYGTRRVSAVDY